VPQTNWVGVINNAIFAQFLWSNNDPYPGSHNRSVFNYFFLVEVCGFLLVFHSS